MSLMLTSSRSVLVLTVAAAAASLAGALGAQAPSAPQQGIEKHLTNIKQLTFGWRERGGGSLGGYGSRGLIFQLQTAHR